MKHRLIIATAIVISIYSLARSLSNFRKLNFPNGISIEVPHDWKILTDDENAQIGSAARNTGQNGKKIRLLAANTNTNPPIAMARLSLIAVTDGFSQDELRNLDNHGLKDLIELSEATEEYLQKQGGFKIVQFDPIRIGDWGKDKALVIGYARLSVDGGKMTVRQYKIPTSHFILELTLSHRAENAEQLLPTITHIRDSLKY